MIKLQFSTLKVCFETIKVSEHHLLKLNRPPYIAILLKLEKGMETSSVQSSVLSRGWMEICSRKLP